MASSKPLISVIIPVYNQMGYLGKCLDSVISQDYTNLQIIIIDDGSTDGSGAVCDAYAVKDDRIIVKHKPNGGLSSARNEALKHVKGDFIAFVDSDDWIERDMISYLHSGLVKYNADISICGHFVDYPNGSTIEHFPRERCLTGSRAVEWLIDDIDIRNYMWNKFFKKELFDGITFPEGMSFEDIGTTYKTFLRAKRVLLRPQPKYHYVRKEGSIVHVSSMVSMLNAISLIEERYSNTKEMCSSHHHFFFFDSFYQSFLSQYRKDPESVSGIDPAEIDRIMIQFVVDNYESFILPNCFLVNRKIYGDIRKNRSLMVSRHLLIIGKLYSIFLSKYKRMMKRIRS